MPELTKIYNYKPPTKLRFEDEAQLEIFLDNISSWCVEKLVEVQNSLNVKDPAMKTVMDWGKANKTFPEMCAISQEIISGALEHSQIMHRPFLSNTFKPSIFNHCTTVMPYTLSKEPDVERLALLDPTFNQFQMPEEIFKNAGMPEPFVTRQPKFILQKTAAGSELWDRLSTRGHVLLDEVKAQKYLESLYWKSQFSPEESLRILRNPPPIINQVQHGHARIMSVVKSFPDLTASLTAAPN